MKEIVVISGKGGTGKTSVVAGLAALAEEPVLADCDVDAADLHLILSPTIKKKNDFSGGKRARVITEKCTACWKCVELCRFEAVRAIKTDNQKVAEIDPVSCEVCGVCAWFCPEKAIAFADAVNGEWYISDTRFGPMVHARLGIAEENSGKLVTIVRKQAREIAEGAGRPYLIVDGSPGIGCPVIASITGADLIVIVTEPTLSGQHDLERVTDLAKHFQIPAVVCINKYDINPEIAERIEASARKRECPVVGRIPYDKSVTKAQIMKASIVEYSNGPATEEIRKMWRKVTYELG